MGKLRSREDVARESPKEEEITLVLWQLLWSRVKMSWWKSHFRELKALGKGVEIQPFPIRTAHHAFKFYFRGGN